MSGSSGNAAAHDQVVARLVPPPGVLVYSTPPPQYLICAICLRVFDEVR
jgi:hypothetical protein